MLNEIRQKKFVIEIEKQNGEQEYFQVHQQCELSKNGVIHYQFKSDKYQPDNPVIDVDGFDAFQKCLHNKQIFFNVQNSSDKKPKEFALIEIFESRILSS